MANLFDKNSPEEHISVIGTLLLALVTAVIKRSPELTETMVDYLQTLVHRANDSNTAPEEKAIIAKALAFMSGAIIHAQ
jgi:hypothetical protein